MCKKDVGPDATGPICISPGTPNLGVLIKQRTWILGPASKSCVLNSRAVEVFQLLFEDGGFCL